MVVVIISLMVGVSYPSVTAGIDAVRLATAADGVASFLNQAVNRAERRQVAVEIAILRAENAIILVGAQIPWERRLDLPQGVVIQSILPELPQEDLGIRRFLVLPGGTVPRIGIILANSRGSRRAVHIDPITGVPRIERL